MAHSPELATIGERIAQRRRQLGVDLRRDVTPADLAKMLGVNPATVYRWESGEKAPREDAIAALAKLFGVTPQFLRYGVPSNDQPSGGPAPTIASVRPGKRLTDEQMEHATRVAAGKKKREKRSDRRQA